VHDNRRSRDQEGERADNKGTHLHGSSGRGTSARHALQGFSRFNGQEPGCSPLISTFQPANIHENRCHSR
jgi:hypothetical protein